MKAKVEDTVESPVLRMGDAAGDTVEEDMLSSTSLMKLSENFVAEQAAATDTGTAIFDLSGATSTGATGELATIEIARLAAVTEEDFSIGEEAATMSEVGTKLDLARAYLDMGDPEGARAILDEVLLEGSAVQKQEAQRLMASLP
jgi:pilus assembly protein FimV